MSTPDTLRWWGDQFRTRTSEFYTSHVLVADLNYAADEIESLEAENKKLRELVRDMCDFFCVVPDEPHVFKEELDFSIEVWRRMRELGIEANE